VRRRRVKTMRKVVDGVQAVLGPFVEYKEAKAQGQGGKGGVGKWACRAATGDGK
jgi:hypothetical protein